AGKVAVVTGGGGGLGRGIALDLARAGVDLTLCDRDEDALTRTAEELSATGRRVMSRTLDVRDPEAVAGFFAAFDDSFDCRAAPGVAVYAGMKAALAEFGRTIAVELGPEGIRVNAVAPDIVPTEGMQSIADRPESTATGTPLADLTARIGIPMGRRGVLPDVGGCVLFLASDLSAYVTGQTLHVDGGTYASAGWFNWPGVGWRNMPPGIVVGPLLQP